MNKRLTRSDYMFSLLFIFMLISVMAAFFFGLQTGTSRTTASYEKMIHAANEKEPTFTAYHQTYLVSFYHTIYLPYTDFQTKWFHDLEEMATAGGPADPAALFKELSKKADETYQIMLNQSTPESSPLLREAHENYLKSIKLFANTTKSFQSRVNSLKKTEIESQVAADAAFKEAKTFALEGQRAFYAAIVKWNLSVTPDLPGLELLTNPSLSLADWGKLNFNLKNEYISNYLLSNKSFEPFMVQDLVIQIDDLITSGRASKLNLSQIKAIADTLLTTSAVRSGDYLKNHTRFYSGETLPQLPFYSK